jgi:hypothetical protein
MVLNLGGGPTDDKSSIALHTLDHNPNEFSSFLTGDLYRTHILFTDNCTNTTTNKSDSDN